MYVEKLLNKLYQSLNEIVFMNNLPETSFIITTSETAPKWYVKKKNDAIYCITINYNKLFEEPDNIIMNMLHQMIHIYNMNEGKNDVCSNDRYHTHTYEEAAINFGFEIEFITRKGAIITGMSSELQNKIKNNLYFDKFAMEKALQKDEELITKERRYGKQPITWMCPVCKRTAYASPKAKLICGYCNAELIYKKSNKR